MIFKNEKLKAVFLITTLVILATLVLFLSLKPASTLEISSLNEGQNSSDQKNANIFKSILSSVFNRKDGSTVNILTLGRPGQGYSGSNLTDTIVLIHLEPAEKKAVLISLPRDLLVTNSKTGQLVKINSLYYISGIEQLKEKITEITGLPIDYYALIDIVVAKEIITLVDGVNVLVPQDIVDPYFPGPNYSYQTFNLAAGWRYLDGETALRYIRTRYTSPNGDFDRMARQQQVIHLLKQKVLELNLLWDFPTYLRIFSSLRDHIETDLGLMELKSLWQIVQDTPVSQIRTVVIDKKETNLLVGGQTMFGEQRASVVYPQAGQGEYKEIKEYIEKVIK